MKKMKQLRVPENDGGDCPTKMWRWSLKVRKGHLTFSTLLVIQSASFAQTVVII